MIRKTLFQFVAVGFVFGAIQASTARGDEAADKIAELKKLREKIGSLHTVAASVSRTPSGTRESRIEIWEKNAEGKHKFRRLATAKTEPGTPKDQTAAPVLMVKDGVTAWREMDMDDKKMVFKGKPEIRNEYTDMEPQLKSGVVKISSGEKVLDQPCVLLEIREKANPDDVIASYWISEKNGVALKSIVKSAGPTVTEMTVTELKLDEELADSLFTYRPPSGAEVIENK